MDVARRQAEDANRSKTEFLGRMSHELRTPLNSVLGFTNILPKKTKLEARSQEFDFLQRIRLNGMHLLNLVNDLLDLNRIAEGEMTVDLKELDLGSLIEETVGQALGLPISRALCDLMGMRLSVESVLGKGSTFTISLAPPP